MAESDDLKLTPEELEAHQAHGDLLMLVGCCISQFSNTEESLAALFGIAAGIPTFEMAFRINDEIREFQYRLAATDSVVRTWVDQLEDKNGQTTLLNLWNALRETIKEDSQDRNRIAHSKIVPQENDDGTITGFVCPYFQYYSHITEFRAQKGDRIRIPDGVRKYDAKSMTAKLKRFAKTAKRIDEFISLLFERGAQRPK